MPNLARFTRSRHDSLNLNKTTKVIPPNLTIWSRDLPLCKKKEEPWFSTKALFPNIGDYIVIVIFFVLVICPSDCRIRTECSA